jgi:hypothetical protein
VRVLILRKACLVYLANPKTASQAIRAMLGPHAERPEEARAKPHMNAGAYGRHWAARVTADLGKRPETLAVMRDPMDHMQSWFRYRQRDALLGHRNSTAGISFAQFVEDRLSDTPPPHAVIGRQDRFLGFIDGGPPVTHVFDYARLDLLVDFLQDRLGVALDLGMRNVSPRSGSASDLPEGLAARYRRAHRTEIALYELVAEKGHLITA